jgi:hypothetical protein
MLVWGVGLTVAACVAAWIWRRRHRPEDLHVSQAWLDEHHRQR